MPGGPSDAQTLYDKRVTNPGILSLQKTAHTSHPVSYDSCALH